MTITITKTKAKAKAKTQPVSNPLEAAAEQYAKLKLELTAKLAKLAALTKQVEASEKAMLAMVDEQVADDVSYDVSAGQYVVKVGAKGRKAVEFDNALIRKTLGREVFDQLAQFPVEELKKYMTGEEFEAAVKYAHVNKRKVTIEEATDA